MKFYFRYGMFLINVINNDQDGMDQFSKIQSVFQIKVDKKDDRQFESNNQSRFCDNSGAGFVIPSTLHHSFCTIIHVNDEIEGLFGYKRKQLLDCNVRILMPRVIGLHHDGFVGDFFEKGKIKWKDQTKQSFGQSKEGFILKLDIVIKLYPKINGEIKLAGLLQRSQNNSKETLAIQEEAQSAGIELTKHMILTDRKGYISNISVGLVTCLGLHPKFFQYSHDSFLSMVRIDQIAENILEAPQQELMESDGMIITFDTREILTKVEAEQLTAEDLDYVRPLLKRQDIFVRLTKIPLTENDYAIVYSLQMLRNSSSEISQARSGQLVQSEVLKRRGISSVPTSKFGMESDSNENLNQSMSSVSSSTNSNSTFNSIVRDFKKTLMDRRMPKQLVILNWLLLATIIQGENSLKKAADITFSVDQRNILYSSTTINVNTYIGIANNFLPDRFPFAALNTIINRSVLLLSLIQSYQQQTQNHHNKLLQLQNGLTGKDLDSSYELIFSQYEEQNIDILVVDAQNYIEKQPLQFKSAMLSYLLDTSMMQYKKMSDMWFPIDYITRPIVENHFESLSPSTQTEKAAYFLYANRLRSIRKGTGDSTNFFHELIKKYNQESIYFVLMVISIIFIVSSVCLIFYQIWQIEHIQIDIFSLYAYLSKEHIRETFYKAQNFMRELLDGSFIKMIRPKGLKEDIGVLSSFNAKIELQMLKQRERVTNEHRKDQENNIYLSMIKRANQQVKESSMPRQLKESPKEAKTLGQSGKKLSKENIQQKGSLQMAFNYSGEGKRFSKRDHMNNYNKTVVTKKGKEFAKSHGFAPDHKLHRFGDSAKALAIPKITEHGEDSEDEQQIEAKQRRKHIKGHTDEVESSSSNSRSFNDWNMNAKVHSDEGKKKLDQPIGGAEEIGEIEERKNQFKKTFRIQDNKRKAGVLFIGVTIVAYFVITYFLQDSHANNVAYIQGVIPLFYNRCRLVHLALAFVRERIFANNTMSSFEYDETYGYDIDIMYNDLHIKNELLLATLKNGYNKVIEPMMSQLEVLDSPPYCDSIIQNQVSDTQSKLQKALNVYKAAVQNNELESVINTIHQACEYARFGNLTALQMLRQTYGMQFEYGDYDKYTALHHAVRANQMSVIEYLIDTLNVYINPKDRWNYTPLDYVKPNTSLSDYLLSRNAKRTVNTTVTLSAVTNGIKSLSQDQAKLYYACFFNDLSTVQTLRALKVNFDIKDHDGRTPLHVAAAEGNEGIVTLLIASGVNVQAVDNRGVDARIMAQKSGDTASYNLLNSVISGTIIKDNCKTFSNAIFKNGMAQAMGAYHKKFQDLLILINSTNNFVSRTTLINGARFQPELVLRPDQIFAQKDIPQFMTGAELYFSSVIAAVTESVNKTYDAVMGQYSMQMMALFVVFLGIQVSSLVVMRRKMIELMREDIYKSRGILNLIPNSFFEQNKQIVEGIMQKLKL
ncbi:hypothetical protein FGO68_gene10995 [Halteria grandinella]|uniref:Uncharacterized protein n=1 Tax=Halteria grandinella TaxID=5974 RepID=A0A8J8TA09_HALGN|nr:hypothetical protein FGO68_gene10995 [Halteria grandinella]